MNKTKKEIETVILLVLIICIYLITSFAKSYFKKTPEINPQVRQETISVLYNGKIFHIFFHSLIVYPKLAFSTTTPDRNGYRDYMITRSEFYKILDQLYKNNFVLINDQMLYKENVDGSISKKDLYIPEGKKPLIISLDDLNYYDSQYGHGLANKLVLDDSGNVATEILNEKGELSVTRDGDVVPILDDFISSHPDFSFMGSKGIIALTGFEGILGYRTNNINSPTYIEDVKKVKKVVEKLKKTGWVFASHSYSHQRPFRDDSISLDELKKDTELWDREVRPLVGKTNIFIGPFGQVFKPNDERRNYLVSKGFNVLYGVGMDLYFGYFPNYIMMDRANIDGIRLLQTPHFLTDFFEARDVVDMERFNN